MNLSSSLAEIPEGVGTDLLALNMKQIFFLGNEMYKAGMIDGSKGAAQAAVKIMAGQSMGLDPVASMRGIFIIGSGFGFYANLLASRIKSSPKYDYRLIALTDDACAIEFFEMVAGKRISLGTERFTREDAKRQGTKNIDKYPRNMLFARTLSNGAKFYTPDVMSGLPIQTEADLGELQVVDEQPTPPSPEEVAAEEERAKTAINRGKKLKPKAAPETSEPAEADKQAETVAEPEPDVYENDELDRMALGELSDMADTMGLKDTDPMTADQLRVAIRNAQKQPASQPKATTPVKAQAEGDPSTYMAPVAPPAPREPATDSFDADEFTPASATQRQKVMAILGELGFNADDEKRKIVAGVLGLESLRSFKEVSFEMASRLIESLEQSRDTEGGAGDLRGFFIDEKETADATA